MSDNELLVAILDVEQNVNNRLLDVFVVLVIIILIYILQWGFRSWTR